MSEPKGPGETRYIANEDGSITRRFQNDPAWACRVTFSTEDLTPSRVAWLLAEAHKLGWDERGLAVRRALGVSEPA